MFSSTISNQIALSMKPVQVSVSGPGMNRSESLADGMSRVLCEAIRKLHDEGNHNEAARGVGSIVYERNNMDFNDYKPVQRIPFSDRPVAIATINHGLANNIIGIQFSYRVVIFELEHKASIFRLLIVLIILTCIVIVSRTTCDAESVINFKFNFPYFRKNRRMNFSP